MRRHASQPQFAKGGPLVDLAQQDHARWTMVYAGHGHSQSSDFESRLKTAAARDRSAPHAPYVDTHVAMNSCRPPAAHHTLPRRQQGSDAGLPDCTDSRACARVAEQEQAASATNTQPR